MNAEEIRRKFIADNAESLLAELKTVLEGTGDFSSKSGIWLGYAFERLSKMVDTANDLKVIEATTTTEIIKAVSKGKITMSEAKELMNLLKVESDIKCDMLGDSVKLPELNITIRKEDGSGTK